MDAYTGLSPLAHEMDSSASMIRDLTEALWISHSYMMMPQLLSGKPGTSTTTAYARPARSPLQLIINQEVSPRVSQRPQQMLHPIIEIFRQQDLGRHLLVLAIPMVIALVSLHNPANASPAIRFTAVALSIGVAATWNGILFRENCPSASKWIELLGVAFIFLAFYGFVGCAMPDKTLIWIPGLCWLLNLLPFAIAFSSRERVLENGNLPL